MGDSTSKPPVQPIRISTSGRPAQITFGHFSPNAAKPRLLDQVRLAGRVALPNALDRKYPTAGKE